MSKILILFFIVGNLYGHNLPPKFDINKMAHDEKIKLYKSNEKNKHTALIYALCIPTAGHMYTKNWTRSITILRKAQLSIPSATFVLMGTVGGATSFTFLGLIPWYFPQIQDAKFLTNKYNIDLYEQIYDNKFPIELKKSIFQKWIEKNN